MAYLLVATVSLRPVAPKGPGHILWNSPPLVSETGRSCSLSCYRHPFHRQFLTQTVFKPPTTVLADREQKSTSDQIYGSCNVNGNPGTDTAGAVPTMTEPCLIAFMSTLKYSSPCLAGFYPSKHKLTYTALGADDMHASIGTSDNTVPHRQVDQLRHRIYTMFIS
jgi:hypothetical protein